MNGSMLNGNNSGYSNFSAVPDSMFANMLDKHGIAAPELLLVDRVVTPIWYVIGLIGNPLSTKIWLSSKVRKTNPSAIYLGTLAIVHTLFILLHIESELLQAWGVRTYNRPIICEIYLVTYMTTQYLPPLLILGFTFERYLAIRFPFLKESYCTVRTATYAVFILTLIAFAFGLVQAYVWNFVPDMGVCYLRDGTDNFYEIWTWFSEMLIFAAVPLTVLIFNILVIVEIKRINLFGTNYGMDTQSPHQTATITLLSVSFYLICTLLPATVVYATQISIDNGDPSIPPEMWSKHSSWTSYLTYYHIRRIIEEISFSNYACYVFVYLITSSFFREEALNIIKCLDCKNCCTKRHELSRTSTYTSNGARTASVRKTFV